MTCADCRYWSDLIARAGGATDNPAGDTEALCLVKGGPHSGEYTTGEMSCDRWKPGTPIDDPRGMP
jgi:hypothetical protein